MTKATTTIDLSKIVLRSAPQKPKTELARELFAKMHSDDHVWQKATPCAEFTRMFMEAKIGSKQMGSTYYYNIMKQIKALQAVEAEAKPKARATKTA